jgi:hypothetical protein
MSGKRFLAAVGGLTKPVPRVFVRETIENVRIGPVLSGAKSDDPLPSVVIFNVTGQSERSVKGFIVKQERELA